MLDHDKLDVYHLELKFLGWTTQLMIDVKQSERAKIVSYNEVLKQLDRASLSMLLNTVEGNGKRRRQLRAKFFDDARGSATECAACLDALVVKKLTNSELIHEGKQLLERIVAILTKLVIKFESQDSVEESQSAYGFEDEDEIEIEDEQDYS